ncbi:hypothetical protein [Hymenobacter daecheongensis]|nr:hypothetical protein [Hymenobacter daecheongensis]
MLRRQSPPVAVRGTADSVEAAVALLQAAPFGKWANPPEAWRAGRR